MFYIGKQNVLLVYNLYLNSSSVYVMAYVI